MEPHERLHLTSARQHHVWTRDQAISAGFAASTIDRLVERGLWRRHFDGPVYTAAGGALPWLTELNAARLRVGTDAVVARFSAARIWQMPDFASTTNLEFWVPRGHTPRIAGIEAMRTRYLPPTSVTRHSNLPVADASRTLQDLAPVVDSDERLLIAAAEMWRLGRTDPMRLIAEVHARPRIPGNPRLRRVIERLDERFARTRSPAEIIGLIRLSDLGYDDVQVNVRMGLSCGRNVEVDVLLGDRAVLEVHSGRWHGTVLQQRRDAERKRALEADGFVVAELWADEFGDTERVRAVVEDLLNRAYSRR